MPKGVQGGVGVLGVGCITPQKYLREITALWGRVRDFTNPALAPPKFLHEITSVPNKNQGIIILANVINFPGSGDEEITHDERSITSESSSILVEDVERIINSLIEEKENTSYLATIRMDNDGIINFNFSINCGEKEIVFLLEKVKNEIMNGY